MTQTVLKPITKTALCDIAKEQFDDMVKAVVDIDQGIMAIGGELHADEEAMLLESGSRQENLWGINLYLNLPEEEWVEFDSMINVRPSQNNRSRSVEDFEIRSQILEIVKKLVIHE
jgi:shikimate kinase